MLPFLASSKSPFRNHRAIKNNGANSGNMYSISNSGWVFVIFLVVSLALGRLNTTNIVTNELAIMHAKISAELSLLKSQNSVSTSKNSDKDAEKIGFFTEKLSTNEEKLYQLQMDFQFHQENVEELDEQLTGIFKEHQKNLEVISSKIDGIVELHSKLTPILNAFAGTMNALESNALTVNTTVLAVKELHILIYNLLQVIEKLTSSINIDVETRALLESSKEALKKLP